MLDDLNKEGRIHISSKQMAQILGSTDVKIRKDISNFAPVGKPRVGYKIAELKGLLEEFVQKSTVHAVLFGVGNLGTAILKYPEFQSNKIRLVSAFDIDPKKIGKTLCGIRVYAYGDAKKLIPKSHAEIGIIASPKEQGQDIADLMVRCGLKGIMNFAPTTISVPPHVLLKNVDLSIELMSLFCDVQQHSHENAGGRDDA